jgi:uncharacterized protein YacL
MILRLLIILICGLIGYIAGLAQDNKLYGLIGLSTGLSIILIESLSRKLVLGRFFGALIGIATGTLFGIFLSYPLKDIIPDYYNLIRAFSVVFFGYLGLLIGAIRGKGLKLQSLLKLLQGQSSAENLKILDTSVIIDGRIADICETGFMEGIFIVPQFILRELQHIADSHDPLRRARGRRGLDILHRIQKISNIEVRIVEEDFPNIKEVDSKLIALAKAMNAKVITNDFNLNKVAEVQGVPVLNINELANALRPVVLPGEKMKVFIIKEGKEYNQGVAYLDDGTMVVVENGRRYIGKNVETVVTSVLQSTAGRMIFTRIAEEVEREEAKTR